MIWCLRIVFAGVLVTMLCVTTWAGAQVPLWQTPRALVLHPWFIATLFDTYFAFLTFWLWLAYRERSNWARLGWLIGILLLGNIAMAAYMLRLLWRLPPDAPLSRVLLRPGSTSAPSA
jgi:signal transduction histidine kinase